MKEFNFKSNIKSIQNNLMANNIRDASNIQFVKSEEAIKDIIKSYTNRFNELGNMLTDISKYVVSSEDIIDISLFNDLFESIHLDIYSLYSDLNSINDVLKLNSERNKQYFLTIKKRIKNLWKKLDLTRNYVYDSNPSDESFYESFSNTNNLFESNNIVTDKKNGFLYLDPINTRTYNKSSVVKSVTSTTYPEENKDADIIHATNDLNTYEYNYESGPRDMLHNGLWKEEIILKEIPSMSIDIGLQRNITYEGVVSIVDIEYNYPIEFNRLDVDLFGEKDTSIDAVLYKRHENDSWNIAKFVSDDPLSTQAVVESSKDDPIQGNEFNLITFKNIDKVKAKYLRIIFNQKNYTILKDNQSKNILDNRMNNDLSERRYELLTFEGTNFNKPLNDSNKSLYNKVIKVTESTKNIESILDKISEIIFPTIEVKEYHFKERLKYEIGAWSIEPKLDNYTRDIGSFESNKYVLNDKSLLSVSLKTSQKIPSSCTCNWYINVNGNNIPIAENNYKYRKEPINVIDMSSDPFFKEWTDGTFVALDFPVDVKKVDNISLYVNSTHTTDIISNRIGFLNSKLLYIKDMRDPYNSHYVIRYPMSIYNSVLLYGLTPSKSNINDNHKKLHRAIISTRRSLLKTFINTARFIDTNELLSTEYNVTNIMATRDESDMWFGNEYQSAIFMDYIATIYITTTNNFDSIIKKGNTKLTVSRDNTLEYFSGIDYGYCDLSILGSLNNISTTGTKRI